MTCHVHFLQSSCFLLKSDIELLHEDFTNSEHSKQELRVGLLYDGCHVSDG